MGFIFSNFYLRPKLKRTENRERSLSIESQDLRDYAESVYGSIRYYMAGFPGSVQEAVPFSTAPSSRLWLPLKKGLMAPAPYIFLLGPRSSLYLESLSKLVKLLCKICLLVS